MGVRFIRYCMERRKIHDATAWGEYLAEGAVAPMYMLRRGPWKFIHTPTDPDQLFNLADDPEELKNLVKFTSVGQAAPG